MRPSDPTELFVLQKASTQAVIVASYFCVSSASILRADSAWECFLLFQALSSCWVTAVWKDNL